MAKNISLLGADYPDVPAVQLPQTGGGTATFYDIKVVDNLNSDSSTDALSAKQGKVLDSKLTKQIFSIPAYDNRVENYTSTRRTEGIKSGNVITISISAKALSNLTSSQNSLWTIPSGYIPSTSNEISFPVVIYHSGTPRVCVGLVNYSNGNINVSHGGLSTGDEIFANFSYAI